MATTTESITGSLFSALWHRYDDAAFKHSVELFGKRWEANGEDPNYFRGLRCLDAGCGGGRYSIAMALLGASKVTGVDLGAAGLEDARRRAAQIGLDQVEFREASVLELPFPEASFDFVCCSGVLHHTRSVERGLRELRRVLVPGGRAYLLLYGAGGLYWPLDLVLRSYASALGQEEVERAIAAAGLTAAKRRTVLDDLFVPILETYTSERLAALLAETDLTLVRRWQGGRLDHESDPDTMVAELVQRADLWEKAAETSPSPDVQRVERALAAACNQVITAARELIAINRAGKLSDAQLRTAVIGEGHHRFIVERPR